MICSEGFEMWTVIIFVDQLSSLGLFIPEWVKRSRSMWRKLLDCGMIQVLHHSVPGWTVILPGIMTLKFSLL